MSAITSMIELRESYRIYQTLSQEIDDWEEIDEADLSDTFLSELPRLLKLLNEFRISTCSTGATDISTL